MVYSLVTDTSMFGEPIGIIPMHKKSLSIVQQQYNQMCPHGLVTKSPHWYAFIG